MSATDQRGRPRRGSLAQLPEFDLAYLYDDTKNPREVTIFPSRFDENLATNWITMDIGHAVSLERVR